MANELLNSAELQNTGKIILPGGAGGRDFYKPSNFEKKKKKLDETGNLDLQDFNNTKEIGQFLDWYNESNKTKRSERFENEVLEISKFLVKVQGRKTILVNNKK